jgi:hypothetical protein
VNAPVSTPPAEQADWARYAQLKQDWIARHPDATPAEFEAAVAQIAKECGV